MLCPNIYTLIFLRGRNVFESDVWYAVHNFKPWFNFILYLNVFRFGKQRLTAVGIRCAGHMTPLYPQKLALASLTGGGRSVGQDPVGL